MSHMGLPSMPFFLFDSLNHHNLWPFLGQLWQHMTLIIPSSLEEAGTPPDERHV